MTQQNRAQGGSGRALALARRRALSAAGKAATPSGASDRGPGGPDPRTAPQAASPAPVAAMAREPVAAPAARSPVRVRASADGTPVVDSGRKVALARRRSMSSQGKLALARQDRVREGARATPTPAPPPGAETPPTDDRCSCGGRERDAGRNADQAHDATLGRTPGGRPRPRGPRRGEVPITPGRATSLARRRAQSSRGKAGMSANGMTAAQTARATNPELSGRALAKTLREQRSRRGGAGQKPSAPTGRSRSARAAASPGAARDAHWKVGASETSRGRVLTGTMVGRSRDVTGDEAGTCRTVTGTEYMGADIFRDFCQAEPPRSVQRGGVSPTSRGNPVTGNQVGRGTRVTGDEPGTCKQVTGTEYMGANLQEAFCGITPVQGPAKSTSAETRGGERVTGNNVGRSAKVTGDELGASRALTGTQYMQPGSPAAAPPKVGTSATLRGGAVTGTMVGRHTAMTGDEAGSCRNVTGDDYVGLEQFGQFCATLPTRTERKVGVSATLGGERITGTMTGRAPRVTGDEPGTCAAVTGTPYAGAEQYGAYCEPTRAGRAADRARPDTRGPESPMTDTQPAVGGRMTGDARGACESVTGTPYLGTDQVAAVCAAAPAEPEDPDLPPTDTGEAELAEPESWTDFSIASPVHASRAPRRTPGVTGAALEGGRITGPFGMASGKVTGSLEDRFGHPGRAPLEGARPAEPPTVHGRVKSRITGEGIDAGIKVTGDDWDRGDRVTGTEGTSTLARNPSRRGPVPSMRPMAAAMAMARGRPADVPEPVSKVTGGSGNTDKGALITYSGGARG